MCVEVKFNFYTIQYNLMTLASCDAKNKLSAKVNVIDTITVIGLPLRETM